MRFRAADVARAVGGRLVGRDVAIDGASFDSRSLRPGQLFVPIVAGRDGHDFIGSALERGAAAYLTSRPVTRPGTAIEVGDTLVALGALARWARGHVDGPVVGITGSVGKTSTKDLGAVALAAGLRTFANDRSFNNDQGLPVTVLEAPDDVEALVLEMGMRGPGEIARLCAIARPTIGIVTAVAEAHGERLGGIEGVARAKAELVEALAPSGCAILNADDARVRAMSSMTDAEVVLYGESPDATMRVCEIELDELARPRFRVDSPWGSAKVALGVSGRHMALNAAAALAAAGAAGVDLAAAAEMLGHASLSPHRMQVERLTSGAILVDDSYNANPTSMRAAIDALVALRAARRVAVLGVMAELVDAEREHEAVARYASARGIELIASGTDLYGTTPVDDPRAALGRLGPSDAVLVKGSRVAALDRVAAVLRDTR